MLTDRMYPNYYPHFDIKRALRYKVESTGEELSEGLLEERLPSELIDASSVMAHELLAAADWLIDAIDEQAGLLRQCFAGKDFDGITVDDYDLAISSGDYETVAAFEEYHTRKLSGLTSAEIYCLLLQLKDKAEWLRDFIKDNVVPIKVKGAKRLAEAEEEFYSQLAYMEYKNPGSIDRLALAYEAQLKYQLMKRIEGFTEVLNTCSDIARLSLNDACGGNAELVAEEIAAGGQKVAEHLITVLGLAFADLADDAMAYKEQDRQIGLEDIRRNMLRTAVSLKELRLDASRAIINWLMSLNAEDEESPFYALVNFALDGLTAIDGGLDTTLLDSYKSQKLERQVLDKYLGNIYYRKQIRHFVNLARGVLLSVDFNRPEEERRRQGQAVGAALARKSEGVCN